MAGFLAFWNVGRSIFFEAFSDNLLAGQAVMEAGAGMDELLGTSAVLLNATRAFFGGGAAGHDHLPIHGGAGIGEQVIARTVAGAQPKAVVFGAALMIDTGHTSP